MLYLSVDVDLVLLPLLGRFVFLLLGVKDLTVLLGSLLSLDSKISGLEISPKFKCKSEYSGKKISVNNHDDS